MTLARKFVFILALVMCIIMNQIFSSDDMKELIHATFHTEFPFKIEDGVWLIRHPTNTHLSQISMQRHP